MEQIAQTKMLVQSWLLNHMYTLLNRREFEKEQDQQKQMVLIKKKTCIGKGPPKNGLELKVSHLVGFIQLQINQVEVFHHQAQSIFQVVDCVI